MDAFQKRQFKHFTNVTYEHRLDNSFNFKEPELRKYYQEGNACEVKIIKPTNTIYDSVTQELSLDYEHIVTQQNGKEESIQEAYASQKGSGAWLHNNWSAATGNTYVSKVGKLYNTPDNYLKNSSPQSRKAIKDMVTKKRVYIIAFSRSVSTSGLNAIADEFSIKGDSKRVFRANSGEDLSKIFQEIGESINNDLWMVNGPKW